MHKALVIIAFLGLLVSGYLTVTYTAPAFLVCGEEGGCHEVQASPYSAFFGIPTAAYGVLFYFILGTLAALWTTYNQKMSFFLLLWTSVGFAVSIVLSGIEAFVLEAWCTWCVTSAILAALAFFVASAQFKRKHHDV